MRIVFTRTSEEEIRMKNRRGFTLVEMVIVIAIIVFLAGVTLNGLSQYSKRANDLKANMNAHSAAIQSQEAIIDGYLMSSRPTTANATTNNSVQAGGQNIPYEQPTETSQTQATAPQTEATQAQTEATTTQTEATTTTTQAPTETEAPANEDGPKVEAKNGFVTRGTPGNGVISIQKNADGSVNVKLLYNQWNDGEAVIKKNADGSFTLRSLSGNNYYLGDKLGYNHDYSNGFKLSNGDINKLKSTFGLEIK